MTEREIGSEFRKGRSVLAVVQTAESVCAGCYYEKSGRARKDCISVNNLGACHHAVRTDGKSVIFKLIKTMQHD